MSDNVHPNPCPIFPCSVCSGNVTWWGRSVQYCTCSNWIHLQCLLHSSRFKTLSRSHSWSFPPCCVLFFWRFHTYQNVTSSSDSSNWYTSIAQSGPLLLMQHLPSNLLSLFRSLCIFFLCTFTTASCTWQFLFTSCFLFPSLTPSGFFNGMLGVSKPGALNCFTLFHLILLTSFVSRNLTLIYLPLSKSLDSLLCDPIAPTPDLVIFY